MSFAIKKKNNIKQNPMQRFFIADPCNFYHFIIIDRKHVDTCIENIDRICRADEVTVKK